MGDYKASAAKADASAKSLMTETRKEERNVEAKTGRDLKKGADRVEERARSADAASTARKSD
ncbi:hypothetical protein [Mesorhizobium sp. CN2-181]|uniref:hypothetical protein n=1 Tax=Mesorhizobium yinganensis TaxID=3157707 RepID=UPI0032B831C3